MTNYIITKEKLREILLSHKSFISQKVRNLTAHGIDVTKMTYKETDKLTDEFIETMINKLPVDNLLDQVDEVMEKTLGFTSKDVLEKENKKCPENE